MSNFWDTVLLMVSTFFFIAYLIVLFQVVVDLFRDSEMGGGSKVIWLIGLIFLPVLTALIYILARGRGMADRQRAAVRSAKADTDAYIREVAAKSPAELFKLQSEMARRNIEAVFTLGTKNGEALLELAKDAAAPITKQANAVVETLRKVG